MIITICLLILVYTILGLDMKITHSTFSEKGVRNEDNYSAILIKID